MEIQIKKQLSLNSLLIAEKKDNFEAMFNDIDKLDDNELYYEAKKKINTTRLSS